MPTCMPSPSVWLGLYAESITINRNIQDIVHHANLLYAYMLSKTIRNKLTLSLIQQDRYIRCN
jgi:hypothetical protein